jgi:ABC-2 type transport system permease protein
MNWLKVVKGEIYKQHRNSFHSKITYFSLLIWPILHFSNAYFSYKPFSLDNLKFIQLDSNDKLISFLLIGFLTYLSFKSLMQSAWQMSYERSNGTLETIFLSPANRLSILYGRTLGALFENIWMFFVFTIFMLFIIGAIPIAHIIYLPVCFLLIIVTATFWGGLLNAIFLFSRDASILFMILDDPMMLFSGVRIPVALFPVWAQVIGFIFPLTHVLFVIRDLLLLGTLSPSSINSLWYLVIELALMLMITLLVVKRAEHHARVNGNLTFY